MTSRLALRRKNESFFPSPPPPFSFRRTQCSNLSESLSIQSCEIKNFGVTKKIADFFKKQIRRWNASGGLLAFFQDVSQSPRIRHRRGSNARGQGCEKPKYNEIISRFSFLRACQSFYKQLELLLSGSWSRRRKVRDVATLPRVSKVHANGSLWRRFRLRKLRSGEVWLVRIGSIFLLSVYSKKISNVLTN